MPRTKRLGLETRTLNVTLTTPQFHRLIDLADRYAQMSQRPSLSQLVNIAVDEFLEDREAGLNHGIPGD